MLVFRRTLVALIAVMLLLSTRPGFDCGAGCASAEPGDHAIRCCCRETADADASPRADEGSACTCDCDGPRDAEPAPPRDLEGLPLLGSPAEGEPLPLPEAAATPVASARDAGSAQPGPALLPGRSRQSVLSIWRS